MSLRYLGSLVALTALLCSSGCCWDRFCCRHPCAPRCRAMAAANTCAAPCAPCPPCAPCDPCGPYGP
jgi:hypothetical protein